METGKKKYEITKFDLTKCALNINEEKAAWTKYVPLKIVLLKVAG